MLKSKQEQAQMTPEELKEYKKELNRIRVQKYRDANRNTDEYKLKHKEETYKYRKEHPDVVKELNKKHSKVHREKVMNEKQKEKNKTDAIIKIQNAIRNKNAIDKFSTLYVEKQKQIKANELAAQMVQQNELKDKLNASVVANDILNSIFPQVINSIPEKQQRVKLVAKRIQPTEAIVKRRPGRPRKPRNPIGRPPKSKNN